MRNIFNPMNQPGQIDPRVNIMTGEGTYSGQPLNMQQPQIMQPNLQTGGYSPQAPPMEARPLNEAQRMRELYQPEMRAQEQLYELLGKIPERNKPGILRKIAASAIGLGGGPEAADKALYAPYYQQMQDFEARFKPTLDVAQQERLQNANLLNIARAVLADETAQGRLSIQQQQADTARMRAETGQKRAEAYIALQQFKMQNPDWEIVRQEGGNYILINPRSGEAKDTGIKTGTMDELQELNLRIKGQKEVAAIPRTTITSGTTTTTTTGGTGDAESATQQKVAQYNRAREMFNKNPALQRFINLGDPATNDFTIEGPSGPGWFSPGFSQEDYDKIIKYIYEGGTQPTVGSARTTTTTSTRQSTSSRGNPPAAPTVRPAPRTGTVRVKAPDGRTGTWDLSKGPIPQGFVEIK